MGPVMIWILCIFLIKNDQWWILCVILFIIVIVSLIFYCIVTTIVHLLHQYHFIISIKSLYIHIIYYITILCDIDLYYSTWLIDNIYVKIHSLVQMVGETIRANRPHFGSTRRNTSKPSLSAVRMQHYSFLLQYNLVLCLQRFRRDLSQYNM